ncbi:MAG: 4'-phosphopantetheinyl transferase superfamily protein [Lachnospiraceae bacterium]|nr:4'-phosphopantetheinyl transferase superfamily protein [Lachnospiraceae bacterium]
MENAYEQAVSHPADSTLTREGKAPVIDLRIDRLDRYRDEDLERLEGFLSPDQREKLSSIRNKKARRQSALAADLLEGAFLDLGIHGPLHYGKLSNGKPCLIDQKEVDFSVSHAGNLAAAAAIRFSNQTSEGTQKHDMSLQPGMAADSGSGTSIAPSFHPCLGIDVEDLTFRKKDPDLLTRLAERFFRPEEARIVREGLADGLSFSWEEEDLDLSDEIRLTRRFYRIWTFKEAYAKALDRPLIRVLKEEPYRPDRPDLLCWAGEESILSLILAGQEIRPENVILHGSYMR